jgi:hypothetical protein
VVRVRMRYQSIDKILRHCARLNCSTKPIRLGSVVVQDSRMIAKNRGWWRNMIVSDVTQA